MKVRLRLDVKKNGVWGTCGSYTSWSYNGAQTYQVQRTQNWSYAVGGYYYSNCGANYYFAYSESGVDSSWGSGTGWRTYWIGCDVNGDSHYFY